MQVTRKFFVVLCFLTGAAFGNRWERSLNKECPQPESISKCSCVIKRGGPVISCSRLATNSELEQVLKALKDYSISKLELTQFNATTLPTDLFKGLHVEEIVWDKVEVEDASFRRGRRHFQGLEDSLETLEIRKSFRSGQRPLLNLQLDHLKNLQVAIFEDNEIPEVGDDWFANGPEKLSTLIFERNGIEELGGKAFASLKNLNLLAIAGNHLNTLTRSMLPGSADKLMNLDLANNKIRDLPTDIFSQMPSLEEVNLEHNLIYSIPENTWSSVWSQLQSANFKGNPLVCDDSLKWICKEKSRASGKCSSPVAEKGKSLQQFCSR